ncbi:MAG: peptide chain release factor 1 [Promethearchaeota archaeon]|nr:MAG: peptide chain release factor 1 [Candidatus Lokiarchaeota archaeon]
MSTKKKSNLKRYRTKKLIEDLKDKRGFHTELISLYIPSDKKISDITNYLKNEISESQNIKSKLTRKNVLDSISSLIGQLRTIPQVPEDGLIMFSGAIPQNDTPGTEKNELYIIDPPDVVNTFRYHCDSEFLLWPLEDMLESKATYGLIVISRQRSAVGYVKGNRVEVVREFTSGIHSKHRAGGQSQRRFERLIEEGEKRFYRRISDQINTIFLDMENLKGIFIGGPGPSKEKFMRDETLDYRLKDRILDVVDLGYGGPEGIRALVERVKDKIEDIKYVQEKKLMEKFMNEISKETGLAIYGIKEVEKALNYGAADVIIISEELDQYRVKIVCNNCGHEEFRNIKVSQFEDKESDIQDEICPECSSSSFGIVEKNSLVEDLGEMAESTGASIEIISTETELGETLYSTFGGVVALLRYKISF